MKPGVVDRETDNHFVPTGMRGRLSKGQLHPLVCFYDRVKSNRGQEEGNEGECDGKTLGTGGK